MADRVASGDITGRVHVAITGAATGIGAQVALDLAAAGRHVWLLDRDPAGLEAAHERIVAAGGAGQVIRLDITDAAAVASAFATIGERSGGRLSGLVNSAGVIVVGRFETFEVADWERAFSVNVLGTWLTIKHALPLLRSAKPGRVVNLASIAAKLPTEWTAPYNASKAAVVSLTRSAALSFAPDVLVNCVCPGPVGTSMYGILDARLEELQAPAEVRFASRSTSNPMGRPGTTEEVSAAICFLLSDAAGYITGEDLNVSGGMVMF
jgi:NAD(P)-dependent dehydrogenase (short-subunit alcohol dehydrogenase family)